MPFVDLCSWSIGIDSRRELRDRNSGPVLMVEEVHHGFPGCMRCSGMMDLRLNEPRSEIVEVNCLRGGGGG